MPKRITGAFAFLMSRAASAMASAAAAPVRAGPTGVRMRSLAGSFITSLGKATKAAPGRGLSAARKAFATTSPMAASESTSTLYLLTPRSRVAVSRL